jgi:hypothetical protein
MHNGGGVKQMGIGLADLVLLDQKSIKRTTLFSELLKHNVVHNS